MPLSSKPASWRKQLPERNGLQLRLTPACAAQARISCWGDQHRRPTDRLPAYQLPPPAAAGLQAPMLAALAQEGWQLGQSAAQRD